MSPLLAYPSPSRNDLGADAPLMAMHYHDTDAEGPRSRKRSISNWRHHKNEFGLWVPSDVTARAVTTLPVNWPMPWAPAAIVGGAAKTAVSGTGVGGWVTKVAHRSDLWMSVEPANRLPNVSPSRSGRTFTWTNVYPEGGTLKMQVHKSGYRKVIAYPGMPTTLPMIDVGVPPGCTLESNGRQLFCLSPEGEEYLHTKPAMGWWGANTIGAIKNSQDQTGKGVGRLSLVLVGTATRDGIEYQRFRLTPMGSEWAAATGAIRFDPSTDISGDTDTDMTHCIEGYADNNYGGDTGQDVSYAAFTSGRRHLLLRADGSVYPTGTYTACDWALYWEAATDADSGDGTHAVYRMDDSNASWVEGTNNHFYQAGSACYNYLAYDATTPTDWAGGGPWLISGTDYDATAGLTWNKVDATHGDQYNDYSLPTSWFTDWESTPANNAGIYIAETTTASANRSKHDDPGGTNPPILTITYTTGAGYAPFYSYYRMMGAQ